MELSKIVEQDKKKSSLQKRDEKSKSLEDIFSSERSKESLISKNEVEIEGNRSKKGLKIEKQLDDSLDETESSDESRKEEDSKEDIESIVDEDSEENKKDTNFDLDENSEIEYRRIEAEIKAYEQSFKAYQQTMNAYFNEVNNGSYSKSYSKKKDAGSDRSVFDVMEQKRQEMIAYTKESFKNRVFANNDAMSMNIEKNREYEVWKAISATNLALSFIYYDRPSMIDCLGEKAFGSDEE